LGNVICPACNQMFASKLELNLHLSHKHSGYAPTKPTSTNSAKETAQTVPSEIPKVDEEDLEIANEGTISHGGLTVKIPIERIIVSKDNPRQNFDEEGLRRLGESIKTHGQLQPIIVRPCGSSYELVVGERRVRASVLVGLESIDAEVKDMDDSTVMETRLIENTQREDLSDAEKGDAVLALWALGKYETIREIAKEIGFSEDLIANWVRKATKLSEKVRELSYTSTIPEDAALKLVKYPHSVQEKLANAIVKYDIRGGKSGEHPYRDFLNLYDQNPEANLEELANKVKGIETVTLSLSEVPTDVLKVVKEMEEKKQLAKVKRIRAKPSKPITKEEAQKKIAEKKSDFKFVRARVEHGMGDEKPLKQQIKPIILPNPETPDYTLCQCATCSLFAKHCKGRCWT